MPVFVGWYVISPMSLGRSLYLDFVYLRTGVESTIGNSLADDGAGNILGLMLRLVVAMFAVDAAVVVIGGR